MVADERATEVEADDGGEEVSVERCDDETFEVDPGDFGSASSEEEEAFTNFWVADMDGEFWECDGHDFGECDDEEDCDEGDEAPGPLEVGIFVFAGVLNDGCFSAEGLERH